MIPSFGGIELLNDASALVSGAAFNLQRPSRADGITNVGGVRYEVRRRGRVVVARGADTDSYESAMTAALDGVQEALDLWSLAGVDDLSITGVMEDHIVWWPTAAGLVVRVTSLTSMGFRMRGQLTVGSDTDVARKQSEAALSWHPSFRYFRLSQATDDLVDAFRYAFLALESILSGIAPPVPEQNGRNEGEARWFKRALGEAGKLVDLADFAAVGAGNPTNRVFRDLYPARTATFHAKVGRSPLPLDTHARAVLAATLLRAVRLYLALAETHLGARRPRSGLSEIGFRTYSSSVLSGAVVWASEDESVFSPTDMTVNPSGMPAVELPTMLEANETVPFLSTRMASASAADLESLAYVGRVVAASPSGTPMLTLVLQDRLILGSAGRLEVVFGIRHRNEGPRLAYLT